MEPADCSISIDNGDADLMVSGSMVYQYLGISDLKCERPLILSVLSSLLERATQRNDKSCKALRVDNGGSYGNNFNNNNNNNDDDDNDNGYEYYYDACYDNSPKKKLSIFHGVRAPTISIDSYIARIFKYAKCSPSCFVLAYAYITRITSFACNKVIYNCTQGHGSSPFLSSPEAFIITSFNVHRLLITSVMVAAKFIDDRHYNNAYYAKIGGVSTAEMNALELALLSSLGYRLHMSLRSFDTFCSDFGKEAAMQTAAEAAAHVCIKSQPSMCAPNKHQLIENAGTSLVYSNANGSNGAASLIVSNTAPSSQKCSSSLMSNQAQLSKNEASLGSNSVHLNQNPTAPLASNYCINFDEEKKPSIALQQLRT